MSFEGEKGAVTFYLSRAQIEELDKYAKTVGLSRSGFLTWLLSKALPLVGPMAEVMEDVLRNGLKEGRRAAKK